jgi:hypothetical protein
MEPWRPFVSNSRIDEHQLPITKSEGGGSFSRPKLCQRFIVDLLMPHKFSFVKIGGYRTGRREGASRHNQLHHGFDEIMLTWCGASHVCFASCSFRQWAICQRVSSILDDERIHPSLSFLIHGVPFPSMAHGKYGMIWEYQYFGLILSQSMGRSQLVSSYTLGVLCVLHPSWASMVWGGWDFGIIHPIW